MDADEKHCYSSDGRSIDWQLLGKNLRHIRPLQLLVGVANYPLCVVIHYCSCSNRPKVQLNFNHLL